ncbi:hypothetical protein FB45DRAFT_260850 [Roridomyces roridus]|uniref:Uncharacterized protein n=1 Tax=Roridomyces roridus TaxID=1738132 RepID=A0AAD7B8H6_9AGAR|nr:hypothetical protein FB45DRAFT_260850 [Roridomyces roridus]
MESHLYTFRKRCRNFRSCQHDSRLPSAQRRLYTSMSSAGPPIQSKRLGVYRIVTEKYSVNNQWSKKASQGLRTLLRLTNDIYDTAGPWSFFLMLILTVWVDVFDRTVGLHLVGRVLAVIEEGLKAGRVDGTTLAWAVALRMVGLGLATGLGYWGARLRMKMDSRFEAKMQEFVLKSAFLLHPLFHTDFSQKPSSRRTSLVSQRTSAQAKPLSKSHIRLSYKSSEHSPSHWVRRSSSATSFASCAPRATDPSSRSYA